MKVYGMLERAALEVISDPGSTIVGRIWWNSTDGQAKIADGTNTRALLRNDAKVVIGNSGTSSQNIRLNRAANSVLQLVTADDVTAEGSLSTSLAQLSFKLETYTTAGLPAAAVAGRLAWDSTVGFPKVDTGAAWKTLTTIDGSQVLTNKTISTASNTIQSGAATSGQVLTADGASGTSWTTPAGLQSAPYDATNYSLTASVAASALTIALKSAGGSDPSAGDPVNIAFRSATAATGTYTVRSVTGALSVVVSSGSTLGHVSAQAEYIYVYALDNAGTVELAVSSIKLDEGTRQTSTTEGGAGGADSRTTLYSTTGRSNVGIRLLGRLKSTQATAGTWATAISEISLGRPDAALSINSEVRFDTWAGNHGSGNTTTPRWTNVTTVGTDLTAVQDATNGDHVLVNVEGLYYCNYFMAATGGTNIAITKNGAVGTTQAQAQAIGVLVGISTTTGANIWGICSGLAHCVPGDILRACDQGGSVGSTDLSGFIVRRVR